MTEAEPCFEVEVASVEEFLRLLEERDEDPACRQGYGASGKAVFIAQMMDRRTSNYGFPFVRRYVVAAFAYGRDRVSYTGTTSNAVELPETLTKIDDRQQEAYEEIREDREEIERGLKESDLNVPVREGFLRHAADNGRVRRDEVGSVLRSALASGVSSRSDTVWYSTAARASSKMGFTRKTAHNLTRRYRRKESKAARD